MILTLFLTISHFDTFIPTLVHGIYSPEGSYAEGGIGLSLLSSLNITVHKSMGVKDMPGVMVCSAFKLISMSYI